MTDRGDMAKSKKNKKGLAEKVAGGKANGPAKLNPFDVRFVKDKQAVIGKKKRTEVGKPGITRAKAIKKRKETLLQEFKLKNKTNLFLDKRIGEKDSNLSSEDKMIARFTAERMRNRAAEFFIAEMLPVLPQHLAFLLLKSLLIRWKRSLLCDFEPRMI